MIEIEIKARADHQQIKKRLEDLHASPIRVEDHIDTYYNAPHRDFGVTDEALRIRSVNGGSVLTYKGKKLDSVSKTREEFETPVDGAATRSVLIALGFVESGVVRKTREILEMNDMTICLDSIKGLGDFVEVEILSEGDIEIGRDQLFAFLSILGIKKEDTIRRSYLEMLMDDEGA
ncbi:MAG: class IV adenylate cyclase [Euryarchaeota archaeon]|nr:class IV adenylate cyclase [Euryarchaeota archaeon]